MKKTILIICIFAILILAASAAWALDHDGNEYSDGKSENQTCQWKKIKVGQRVVYVRPQIYQTLVRKEVATTKKCPSKYKGQVKDYQKKGYIVGDGKIDPSKDRRPVSKWEQSLGIGRLVEKQKKRDSDQDQKIAGKLDADEFDEYTLDQSKLDRDQNGRILANTRATRGVWYWIAVILFVAGLALTILFVALRWYWAGGIAGVICFIGLFTLAVMNFGLAGIATVSLIGLIALGVVMWYVYPSFMASPVPIPPPARAGGGYAPLSRPRI